VGDHAAREARGLLEVVLGAGAVLVEDEVLGRAAGELAFLLVPALVLPALVYGLSFSPGWVASAVLRNVPNPDPLIVTISSRPAAVGV